MTPFLDGIMIVALLTVLALLGAGQISFCIRMVAVQGAILGLLPAIIWQSEGIHALAQTAVAVPLKGAFLPWLLTDARRKTDLRREEEPLVGFGASLLIGIVLLGISFRLGDRLQLPMQSPSSLIVPVALFSILAGLFTITSRRNALTQVIGYFVMENGIFAFGAAFVGHQPLLIEVGVLLDLLVAAFIMGIAIFHISREFDHIDIDRLDTLHDTPRQGGNR